MRFEGRCWPLRGLDAHPRYSLKDLRIGETCEATREDLMHEAAGLPKPYSFKGHRKKVLHGLYSRRLIRLHPSYAKPIPRHFHSQLVSLRRQNPSDSVRLSA